jgi:hypothetical protein
MKEPLDVSSFFTTLLRRVIGGKANARGKSHLWEKGATPSGFWVVEGVPAVEVFCLFGGVAGKEVNHGESPSGRDHLEHDGVKSPDWNLPEKRHCIC